MISNNRDGDLIAALVRRFGALAVRGSTYDREKAQDKGGKEAFAAALEELQTRRAIIGITPDGPRGPRMRAQKGAILLGYSPQFLAAVRMYPGPCPGCLISVLQ